MAEPGPDILSLVRTLLKDSDTVRRHTWRGGFPNRPDGSRIPDLTSRQRFRPSQRPSITAPWADSGRMYSNDRYPRYIADPESKIWKERNRLIWEKIEEERRARQSSEKGQSRGTGVMDALRYLTRKAVPATVAIKAIELMEESRERRPDSPTGGATEEYIRGTLNYSPW